MCYNNSKPATTTACWPTALVFALGAVGAAQAKSGDVVWTFPRFGAGASGPSGSVQSSCETYYGIDNAAPLVRNGTVFFVSEHSGWKLFALDAETGVHKWNVTASHSAQGGATAPAADAAGTMVVFAAASAALALPLPHSGSGPTPRFVSVLVHS